MFLRAGGAVRFQAKQEKKPIEQDATLATPKVANKASALGAYNVSLARKLA